LARFAAERSARPRWRHSCWRRRTPRRRAI
jgi:hypothetical protein